jgi:hypothetical protein
MAKVVITIEDEVGESGDTVRISLEADPPISTKSSAKATSAQYLGLIAMKAMSSVGGIESSETEYEE